MFKIHELQRLLFFIISLTTLTMTSNASNDNHDFLYKGNPKLRAAADIPHVLNNFEEKLKPKFGADGIAHYYKNDYIAGGFFLERVLVHTDQNSLMVAHCEQLHLKEKRKLLEKGSPFYQMYFRRKIEEVQHLPLLEDIVLAAQEIHHILQNDPAMNCESTGVIFLGRSPCMVQLALSVIKDKDPASFKPSLIHVNYSGNADEMSTREDECFKGKAEIARNMVTKDKLDFYMWYLATKKLQQYKKLVIVDIISTGGGLNSWMRLLKTFMADRGLVMPNVRFMPLTSFPCFMRPFRDHMTTLSKPLWDYNPQKGVLTFAKNKKLNVKEMSLPTTPIHLNSHTIEVIDDACIARYGYHGFEFPAQMWTEAGYQRAQQGGEWHRAAYENFKDMIWFILLNQDKPSLFSEEGMMNLRLEANK